MKRILITTGNGMFGKALIPELLERDVLVRIMVRDTNKCKVSHPRAEIVAGDLDKPETINSVIREVDAVFLTSPIDPNIATRETNLIRIAKHEGVKQIVKIGGAVKHGEDALAQMHVKSIDALKNSGIGWTLVSPNSVMETSLYNHAPAIKFMHSLNGCSGHGKVGLVALKDIAIASAVVLTTPGHEGMNYEITGPETLDMFEVAEKFSKVLGQKIHYVDMTEDRFAAMLMRFDKSQTREKIELEVLCHLRAWKEGKADLVTDTFSKLTGKNPTSLDEWIGMNKDLFSKGIAPAWMASVMRMINK